MPLMFRPLHRSASGYSKPRIDPNNPVVQLCVAGMTAEGEGRQADAKSLFEQAWAASRDDYEACVAAHYLARRQEAAADELEWNRLALERADRVADGRVQNFYPSLYLNLAHSLEKVGRTTEACQHYGQAATCADPLPDSAYMQLVRSGIAAGRKRTCPTA